MKKIIAGFILSACLAVPLAAVDRSFLIIYAEGRAQVQNAKGVRRPAATSGAVFLDEMIITGRGGLVQLQTPDCVIDIRENSVFTLLEARMGGRKQNAYLCSLGAMRVKVMPKKNPRLGTPAASAGVRGTELEVFAGADGTALVLVAEGAVDVEAQGVTVALNPDEGVEVAPGRAPGPKFQARNAVDYRVWNDAKFDEMMKDPLGSLKLVEGMLSSYVKTIGGLDAEYQPKIDWFNNEVKKLDEIEKAEGKEARYKRYAEIEPTGIEASYIAIETRFQTLSALSLRRFVLGRMYFFMKMKYLGNLSDSMYTSFMKEYERILQTFTAAIQAHVVERDI